MQRANTSLYKEVPWKLKIVKEKPLKCHMCNFEPVSDLLYGVQNIDEQLQKDIDKRKVLLGGCSLLDYSPNWLCSNCQTEYYLYKDERLKKSI